MYTALRSHICRTSNNLRDIIVTNQETCIRSANWISSYSRESSYHAAEEKKIVMEEVQRSDEAAPVIEGPLQNHTPQVSPGLKEEGVKVDITEVAIESPQLFAQIPPPNLNATAAEDLGIETNNNSAVLPNGDVPNAQSIADPDLSHGAAGLEDEEENSFDIYQDSLPLLPSFDDVSTAGIGTSITGSDPQVQAFAKLEFDDGQFYMNTWAVELGRDMGAARKALQQEFEGLPDQNNAVGNKHRSNSSADGGNNANRRKEDSKKVAESVISETGGILNYGPDAHPKRSKSSRRKAKSEGSSSRLVSRSNSVIDLAMETESVNPSDIMYGRNSNVAQPLNPQTHLPSPNGCPMIPIHPPATENSPSTGHRGISRRHAKIQYSFEKRYFEMEVKGRNGAFVDEMYYGPGEVAELRSGCYIQIGGVNIKFILPNVADGETGADPTLASEAVSAMSFDFEDGRGEIMPASSPSSSTPPMSSDEESPSRRRQSHSSDEDVDDEDGEEEIPHKVNASKKSLQRPKKAAKQELVRPPKIKLKLKTGSKIKAEELPKSPQNRDSPSPEVDEEALKALGIDVPLAMIPPRRKGPGRPPKNGFMSKREEASLKKQVREAAKAQAVADGTLPPEALLSPDEASDRRKFSRKENGKEIHESIEENDGLQLQTKLPKEKKPSKPPKSSSPFPEEASLTPEQLAKPQHSYVIMIHEALSSCPSGQMSLPQIYKAIEKRYPYFKYKVTTPGWQSSIRHNLSQHSAFMKTETREGKGWMWCLDPEVSIEKEKRPRRPSPPPMTQQYFPQGASLYRSTFPYQGGQQPSANGTNPGQLASSTSFMSPAPARASDGSLVPATSPASNLATYQSPYGLSNGKRGQTSNANSHNLASTGANPYLLAQTMHRPAQSSPLRTPHTTQTSDYIPFTGQGMANLSAQAVNAISKYKSTLMGSLTMANREILINYVIDKVLGRPVVEFASITDRTAASAIEKPLVGLLQQIREGELAAERQRLAQAASTTAQYSSAATVDSISTSHQSPSHQITSSTPGSLPQSAQSLAQESPSKAAQDQASIPLPTTPAATSVESKHTQPTTAVPLSDKTPQATTPVASPITPQQGSLPEDNKVPAIDSKVAAPTEDQKSPANPASETAPSSSTDKQGNGQKHFLSILSQLGPTTPSTAVNINSVSSARSLKRALDEESQDTLINNSSIEQPRAVKRVAV